jgi:DNA-binding NarL/FixJ family response regulator
MKQKAGNNGELPGGSLTEFERHLFHLLAQGMGGKQIAAECRLAPQTIYNRLSRMYRKIPANNGTHAVILAREAGWLRPPGGGRKK